MEFNVPLVTKPSVSVIGLGHMGSVLAKTFLDRGVTVTIWNRTTSKAAPLIAQGARLAHTPAEAVAASPLTIFCTTNKTATTSILQSPGVSEALKAHSVADLSTGLLAEVRANKELVVNAGGRFLDGGIMGYPRDIGSQRAVILYSGSASAFREYEATLALLAGGQRYLGEDTGATATNYMALSSYYVISLTGFLEGAALAQAAGVDLENFRTLASLMDLKLQEEFADASRRIRSQDYAGDQAPLEVYFDAMEKIRATQKDLNLGHRGLDAFIAYMEASREAGNGSNDISMIFRAMGGKD